MDKSKIEFLRNTPLFRGCSGEEITELISKLDCKTKTYQKGEYILLAGNIVTDLCLVISGKVRIEFSDLWGNTTILGMTGMGGVFAESYAISGKTPLMVNALAEENTEILFISASRLFELSGQGIGSATRSLTNMLKISAGMNIGLSQKIFHSSPKKIRERLMSFLSYQSEMHASNSFDISMNREQMAEYLNLDRSALSKELGKMKAEGLIDFRKNHFEIFI